MRAKSVTNQSILNFGFCELTPKHHFAKDTILDEAIRTRFDATLAAATGMSVVRLKRLVRETISRLVDAGLALLELVLRHSLKHHAN